MATRQNQDAQVKAFWDKTEEELGEEVIIYTMGRCISGCVPKRDSKAQMWGLFFLTERALYFRHFPQQNWLSSFMSSGAGISAGEEIYFSVPMERMQSVSVDQYRTFWQRLFSGEPPTFSIDYFEADGSVQTLRFFLEGKTDAFLKVIQSCRE